MKNLLPKKNIFSFCIILFLCSANVYAQKNDSISNKEPEFFNTENKEISKFRRFYSKILFKNKKLAASLINKPFDSTFVGKPIRNIIVTTKDPFGYSLEDTLKRPEKWIEKTGNTIHGKTKRFYINELLLFKEGELLDSIKIKESERVLRAQRILRRVEILPKFLQNKDSVDVYINTIDSWSMVATGSISTSKIGVRVSERNFMGLGHIFNNRFRHNYKTGQNLYNFSYTVPNIAKSRVVGSVHYFKNELNHFNKGISLQRPFYSPLAKLAGGISFGQIFYQDSLDFNRKEMEYHNIKYNYSDIWAAKAFRISRKENKNISNFIISSRFYERNFKESPHFEADPYSLFSTQKNYFLGVGISSKHYVKDEYIFNYGIEEDIAVGRDFGLVAAFQDRLGYNRFYLGGSASTGGYLKTGYLGAQIHYGSYIRNGKSEQGILNIQSLYFSKLINLGRWKFRQFSKINYTKGFNRFDTPADELSLNEHDYDGLDGIRRARDLNGTQKLMVEFQTQSYTPYQILGFRMAPFLNAAVGVIGNGKETFFNKNNVITRVGIGVMFTNDYFVFNNFQISFSFYPQLPGEGSNVFKTGVINNRDFRLMDFDISKPEYIRWNRWD